MRLLLEREERHAVRSDLITLETACALAFERIYGRHEEDSLALNSPEARNAIAHALVAITPIYTFSDDHREISQINYNDLRGGVFEEGGRRLCFPTAGDAEKRAITRLAIRASAMPAAIEQLQGLRGLLDDLTRNVMVSGPSSSTFVG